MGPKIMLEVIFKTFRLQTFTYTKCYQKILKAKYRNRFLRHRYSLERHSEQMLKFFSSTN